MYEILDRLVICVHVVLDEKQEVSGRRCKAGQVDVARVLATKKPSALPAITAWLSSNSV